MADKVKATRYRAVVKTHSGWLLGGTRKHASTAFDTREDAQRWADVVMSTNKELRNFSDDDIWCEIVEVTR